MSNLIESILSEDFVSASDIFQSRMEQIAEQKLLEAKKQIQAESVGGMSKKEFEYRRNVLKYPRASEVLPDPRDIKISLHSKQTETPKPKAKTRRKKLEEKDLMNPGEIPTQTINRKKDWEDRYKAAKERAKALELRGAKGQTKMVDRTYRAYKVGDVIGRTIKKTGGEVLKGLASLYEE